MLSHRAGHARGGLQGGQQVSGSDIADIRGGGMDGLKPLVNFGVDFRVTNPRIVVSPGKM